ncbi:uncharacterized protein [Musca autumnalis]|uniref:uncharacterized protein n=1 Tax=Musca autumnalis TaxID=221902 RepID=UPI003CF28BC5
MFILNKPFLIILLASVACLYADENIKAVESDSKQKTELKQLKVEQNQLGETQYTFKCTVGNNKTARIGCSGQDRTDWITPHDVALTLRCPPSGTGPIMAFVEIIFTVTSQNVNCHVLDGGIGQNYIQTRLDVYGTKLMDYRAEFYVY